jgi:HEPN domain-containing protein
MERKDIIEFWVLEAEESKEVAQHLFDKNDFSYALFFGHLAIEKLIKALYVKNIDENVPRSHNLPRLAKESGVEIPTNRLHDLITITAFNLETRYPDYKREFRKKCTNQFTKEQLRKIDEVFKWLKSML